MKLGLLGDIHGNHLALAAVLDAARQASVDRLLITGDLVGYYFWPAEVLALLGDWDYSLVRGNHEAMLTAARDDSKVLAAIDKRYGTGLRTALETLQPEQIDQLCRLPHPLELELDGRRCLLCHGAPWNVDQYVYPDADADLLARCAEGGHDWVILGHTHYSMAQRYADTLIVNPGSVGQPRNRKPGAHWALLDTVSGELSLRIETYDARSVIEAARARQPEKPYLHEVLLRQ